jgi:hypothetical protein
MGYINTFLPADIFPIGSFTSSAMGRAPLKKDCTSYSTALSRDFNEIQRRRIHAIALAGWWWTVIKNVPEMRPATCTEHFCAYHPTGGIDMRTDIKP